MIYEAMAYQIAKCIGQLATVVDGEVDLIILTGGIAYSKMITSWVKKRVAFIAPVEIMPGENEMESLALGTLRVLRGEEEAREYVES
jgi:butyrate kinase